MRGRLRGEQGVAGAKPGERRDKENFPPRDTHSKPGQAGRQFARADRTASAGGGLVYSAKRIWRARTMCASAVAAPRSEEHTSELQSRSDLVCRLLLEKKKKNTNGSTSSSTN